MNDELRLKQDLRTLQVMGRDGASRQTEQMLQAAFRRQHGIRQKRWAPVYGVSAMLAASLAIVIVLYSHAVPHGSPVRLTENPQMTLPAGFIPLPYAEDGLPLEAAALVREELPASALREAGIGVGETDDPITADVIYGQDGLARAVRILP